MKQLALLAIFFLPLSAQAAVLINEVAWMGTSANSNAEWIELTNTGSAPVDLSGWKLTASSSLAIALKGAIPAGGYFLLERTRATNISGVTADQTYTGALANTGAMLTLTDASGAVEDQVMGGTNWCSIGGDNTSKDSAQRTSSGWTTALPTPRAANAANGTPASCAPKAPKPSAKTGSSHTVQRVAPALSNLAQPAHDTEAALAPAAQAEASAAGASLPSESPSLWKSPWLYGAAAVLVISAAALIVL